MNCFQEKLTDYLKELAEKSVPVRRMYYADPQLPDMPVNTKQDLLLEQQCTQRKGLIHKFDHRILIMLSYTCAANCRYCERQDRVGIGKDAEGMLSKRDVDDIFDYLKQNLDINEVIFSGGDPLTNPRVLRYACLQFSRLEHIKILRLHTKFPVNNPHAVDFGLLQEIVKLKPVFYFSIHINHPDELNETSIPVIMKIRQLGFVMLSQSVFLKTINDDINVLVKLFTSLSEIGVRPYYIYHCTNIPANKQFVMNIEEEMSLMTELRQRVSGIAYPTHVIDLMNSIGKITIPTNHWLTEGRIIGLKDFTGKVIDFNNYH